MGQYISFDKKSAEALARTLAKQRAREAQKAADAIIWKQLAEEQIERDRERSERHNGHKSRLPKPKPPPLTDHERGMHALERSVEAIIADGDREIQIINRQ